MSSSQYTKIITTTFRQSGLNLRPKACKAILKFLSEHHQEEPQYLIQLVVDGVKEQSLTSAFVDLPDVEPVLQEQDKKLKAAEENNLFMIDEDGEIKENDNMDHIDIAINEENIYDYIQIIDSFKMPAMIYNTMRKTFRMDDKHRQLHGIADEKAAVFRERWQMLHQRTSRNAIFASSNVHGPKQKQNHEIVQIESLIGNEGEAWIFGVLTELGEGKYFIEDLNSMIQVDLTYAAVHLGLFTENCLVLAQGSVQNKVFIITALAHPPPEVRRDTLNIFPQFHYFGLDNVHRMPAFIPPRQQSEIIHKIQLQQKLNTRKEDDILILSDIHLDDGVVLGQLEELFYGLQNTFLPMVVFMGNFCSTAYSVGEGVMEDRQAHFNELAELLSKFPLLCEKTMFIFMAGPNDPGMGNILPQKPLANFFTKKLKSVLNHVIFASNPCRLLYFSLEIVLFRENLLHKMRRNCAATPNLTASEDLSEHMIQTICTQGHLSPLPLSSRPIYWNYDHTLRLYPLPDVLIIADQVDQFEHLYDEMYCFNPGSFSLDYSFVSFAPAKGHAKFKRVNADGNNDNEDNDIMVDDEQ